MAVTRHDSAQLEYILIQHLMRICESVYQDFDEVVYYKAEPVVGDENTITSKDIQVDGIPASQPFEHPLFQR